MPLQGKAFKSFLKGLQQACKKAFKMPSTQETAFERSGFQKGGGRWCGPVSAQEITFKEGSL